MSQAPLEYLLLGAALLLLLSVLASKASGRLGVSALLLFLLIGMLAGSDGPGGIYFDDPRPAGSPGVDPRTAAAWGPAHGIGAGAGALLLALPADLGALYLAPAVAFSGLLIARGVRPTRQPAGGRSPRSSCGC